MRLMSLLLILVALCACGDGRWAPGWIVTEDGQMLANNDENVRASTQATLARQLDGKLGGHWRAEVAIAELPVYQGSDVDGGPGRTEPWMWPMATANITLIGDGTAASPLSEAEVTSAVRDHLAHRVERPQQNLVVTTTSVVDAARFALPAPAAAPTTAAPSTAAPPPAPAASAARTYTVQAGDTWADLGLAFYGSAQHWRRIAEANPGEPTPGRVITIPPKP